jgi:hypothetical protein
MKNLKEERKEHISGKKVTELMEERETGKDTKKKRQRENKGMKYAARSVFTSDVDELLLHLTAER